MRNALNSIAVDGKIIIGEGDEGETDVLYGGQIVESVRAPKLTLLSTPWKVR